MPCSAHESVRTHNQIPATSRAEEMGLAMNALSDSTTMKRRGKDTNTSGSSSSNHIDSNLVMEDNNSSDATCTMDSTIEEPETFAQIQTGDELLGVEERSHSFRGSGAASNHENDRASTAAPIIEYKVYRRRYFGLFQLVLLNVIVSWDVSNAPSLNPAPDSTL